MATVTSPAPQPTQGVSKRVGRRIGYSVAILVNLALLVLVNVWPGWQAVPFLTPETAEVVPYVNASILVSVLVNIVFLFTDSARVKALGDLMTGAASFVATWVLLAVFPFDFSPYAFPWEFLAWGILILALLGTGIGMVVNLVRLVRGPGVDRGSSHVSA